MPAGDETSSSHGVPAILEPNEEAQPVSGMMYALEVAHRASPMTGGEMVVGGSRRGLTAAMEMDTTTPRS